MGPPDTESILLGEIMRLRLATHIDITSQFIIKAGIELDITNINFGDLS